MTHVSPAPVPRVVDVRAIASISNRVIRNLAITECYADLSAAMRSRIGDTADWCTFATWASRQAGSTIRGEDLLDRFRRRLGRTSSLLSPIQSLKRALLRKGLFEPDTAFGRLVTEIHTPFDAFERASDAVARGNLNVFEEIGEVFARFLETVPIDAAPDSPEVAAFANELQPGSPPDGQDYLREAFVHYTEARQHADPRARAACVLLANLKIGLHEQTRLQPQIAAAVDAPIVTAADLGKRLLGVLIPGSRRWAAVIRTPAATIVGWLAAPIRTLAVKLTREVVTDAMMVLALPGRVLSLGENLDAPVPAVLLEATHPDLEAFVKEYDPCVPGSNACGAEDWCELRQRMHYILHLFRAYAQDASLFRRPFTAEQVVSFRAGVVPAGDL